MTGYIESIAEDDYDEIAEAMEDGMITCRCCGESIELDGRCPEGTPSLLIELGMI